MAFAPMKRWNWRSITRWDDFLNRKQPTDSAEEAYFPTAYYAIRAPRVSGTQSRGPIRVHKALAWIHGPGMILTPILGAMAYSQKNNGEKVHGIASAHAPVAIVTAGAYGAALLSVSLKF